MIRHVVMYTIKDEYKHRIPELVDNFCSMKGKIPGLDKKRKVMQISTSTDLIHWSEPELVYKDGEVWGNHYNAMVPDDTVYQPNILSTNRFSILNNHNGTDVIRYPVELKRK